MAWETTGIPSFAERIPGWFRRHDLDEFSRELYLRQEERRRERTRIARELHDTLLQGLLSACMQLHIAQEWLPADSPAKPVLGRVLDLMGRGITEGRAALQGLRSDDPESTTLEQALAEFQNELTPSDHARLRIVIMGRPKPLNPRVLEQVSLIAREALLNSLRHSQAKKVEAEIEYLRRKLRVVIRDNGTGIDPQVLQSGRKSHWGLIGMRERAKSIGAQFRVWSRRKAGTEVEVSVPVDIANSLSRPRTRRT